MNKTKAIYIRLSETERKKIEEKMLSCHTNNMSAYILKMAIDGMIINLDMPELKEVLRLLQNCGNNINQIAKRLNEGKSIYASDISDIKETQTEILKTVRELYLKLLKL